MSYQSVVSVAEQGPSLLIPYLVHHILVIVTGAIKISGAGVGRGLLNGNAMVVMVVMVHLAAVAS